MEITQQQALDCFASDDLIGIGMEADAVRSALHPENVVTYAVPHTIALDQPREDLLSAIEACSRAGDTTACLTCAPGYSLTQIEEALAAIRSRFPYLSLHALSTGDILVLVESSGLGLAQTLTRLRAAGLDSISGEDLSATSEMSGIVTLEAWLEVHRLAHLAGIASTAGLVFGLGETSEDRVRHLFAIRALQAETKGFTAFTLLSPKPAAHLEPPTAVEYLRTLAIARIVLDNIPSIESHCITHGLKVVQMALRFGANDAGLLADPALAPQNAFTEEDLRRVIRDAGFTPVERDPLYRTLFLNN
jgi:cyclic dehypoxanthinyl futalosine synthase